MRTKRLVIKSLATGLKLTVFTLLFVATTFAIWSWAASLVNNVGLEMSSFIGSLAVIGMIIAYGLAANKFKVFE